VLGRTVSSTAHNVSLYWPRSIQYTVPRPISSTSILKLSPHQRLGISNGLFPSGFSIKIRYVIVFPHTCRMLRQSHSPSFDRHSTGEKYESFSSSLCSFLQAVFTSSFLGYKSLRHYYNLEHFQAVLLHHCVRPGFTPIHLQYATLQLLVLWCVSCHTVNSKMQHTRPYGSRHCFANTEEFNIFPCG
jgi:hypothetical protein